MYITIETLWKKRKNKSLIARLTSHDWKTVAKKIKEIEQENIPKRNHIHGFWTPARNRL